MTLATDEIFIAGNGRLYVAPEGTTAPTSLLSALGDFVDLGYLTEDGAKWTDAKTTNDVRPWQSFYPVRTHITERTGSLEFTVMQHNRATIELGFGGGTWSEETPGEYTYHPPSPEDLDVRIAVLDAFDGDRSQRWILHRCFVTSNTEVTFAKSGPALLPVTLTLLANGEGDPWSLITDDPAFGAGGVS